MSVRLFYDRWPQYHRRLLDAVPTWSDEVLALRASPEHMAIWAIVGHIAATRVYWLCHVTGEPGAEATPFAGPYGDGWEDDPDHPRSAEELASALESTWSIIDRVLDTWSPADLETDVERWYGTERQVHTKSSILQRLISHEAYHVGEISQTLGVHGLPEVYIWRAY